MLALLGPHPKDQETSKSHTGTDIKLAPCSESRVNVFHYIYSFLYYVLFYSCFKHTWTIFSYFLFKIGLWILIDSKIMLIMIHMWMIHTCKIITGELYLLEQCMWSPQMTPPALVTPMLLACYFRPLLKCAIMLCLWTVGDARSAVESPVRGHSRSSIRGSVILFSAKPEIKALDGSFLAQGSGAWMSSDSCCFQDE